MRRISVGPGERIIAGPSVASAHRYGASPGPVDSGFEVVYSRAVKASWT
jgi:hypothetical protein